MHNNHPGMVSPDAVPSSVPCRRPGCRGRAPHILPASDMQRSGPPAYNRRPITDTFLTLSVPRYRHSRHTREGKSVKGTVEYRSPAFWGEDMPRKPLDRRRTERRPCHAVGVGSSIPKSRAVAAHAQCPAPSGSILIYFLRC